MAKNKDEKGKATIASSEKALKRNYSRLYRATRENDKFISLSKAPVNSRDIIDGLRDELKDNPEMLSALDVIEELIEERLSIKAELSSEREGTAEDEGNTTEPHNVSYMHSEDERNGAHDIDGKPSCNNIERILADGQGGTQKHDIDAEDASQSWAPLESSIRSDKPKKIKKLVKGNPKMDIHPSERLERGHKITVAKGPKSANADAAADDHANHDVPGATEAGSDVSGASNASHEYIKKSTWITGGKKPSRYGPSVIIRKIKGNDSIPDVTVSSGYASEAKPKGGTAKSEESVAKAYPSDSEDGKFSFPIGVIYQQSGRFSLVQGGDMAYDDYIDFIDLDDDIRWWLEHATRK